MAAGRQSARIGTNWVRTSLLPCMFLLLCLVSGNVFPLVASQYQVDESIEVEYEVLDHSMGIVVDWAMDSNGFIYGLQGERTYPGVALWRSKDQGATWEKIVAFDGRNWQGGLLINSDDDIFVTPGDSTIRKSSDGGRTWREVCRLVGGDDIWCWDIVEDGEGNLFAGQYGFQNRGVAYVWRGVDRGESWEIVFDGNQWNPLSRHVHRTKVDPFTDYLYVTVGDDVRYTVRSKDHGETWEEIVSQAGAYISIAFTEDYRFFGTDLPGNNAILRTRNDSEFEVVFDPDVYHYDAQWWDMAVDRRTGHVYALGLDASSRASLWVSTDSGDSWLPILTNDLGEDLDGLMVGEKLGTKAISDFVDDSGYRYICHHVRFKLQDYKWLCDEARKTAASKLSSAREAVAQAESDIEGLLDPLAPEAEALLEKARNWLDQAKEYLIQAEDALGTATAQYEKGSLKDACSAFQACADKADLASNSASHASSLAAQAQLQEELSELRSEHNDLMSRYDELRKELDSTKKELGSLTSADEALRFDYNKLKTELEALRSDYNRLKADHDSLKVENDELSTAYERIRTNFSRLEAAHVSLQSSHADLETSYSRALIGIASLAVITGASISAAVVCYRRKTRHLHVGN